MGGVGDITRLGYIVVAIITQHFFQFVFKQVLKNEPSCTQVWVEGEARTRRL